MLSSWQHKNTPTQAKLQQTRFSGFAVWFLYTAIIVPIATVPLYSSTRDPSDTFLFALYCAAIWVGIALVVRRRPMMLIPVHRDGVRLIWAAVVVLSLMTYVWVAAAFGITFNIMSVFEVYDTRLLYRDNVVPTVPLLGYLITNQGNVINPLLMAVGAARRRWALVAVGIVGQLILYSTTGYKTVLISIPLCVGIALALRYRQQLSGITVFLSATILVGGSILIDRVLSLGLVELFVNRVFIMAGHLLPHFRDVYDGQPWAMWGYSFLAPFVDTPYTMSPGYYVGAVAFGRTDVQANASLFSDGYANLGLVGIAIEAVFLLILLLLVDSASRGLPLAVVVPTSLLPVFSLANSSPFTALLSLGFALMFILFALYPREDQPEPRRDITARSTVSIRSSEHHRYCG